MGQVGSLPDGSELKEPEEKVSPSTLVNANFGLVFVKPHAHKADCIDFVKDELSKKVKILGGCSIGADAIKERRKNRRKMSPRVRIALPESANRSQINPFKRATAPSTWFFR